jgi:diaminopimelate epimerase
MKLRFTKMHGAGNDFVVIDAINQTVNLTSDQWHDIADRRFGIGADQILVVEKPTMPGVDFRYRIFNADGGEVEQCGNGARAFVKFVVEKGLTEHREIRVETMSGVIRPRLEDDGRITVDMGAPIFDPERVPFDPAGLASKPQHAATLWNIPIEASLQSFVVLSMGNPHAVQLVDDVDTAAVSEDGPLIENHACFPRRVNAGFMQVVDRQHIRLRVFERARAPALRLSQAYSSGCWTVPSLSPRGVASCRLPGMVSKVP